MVKVEVKWVYRGIAQLVEHRSPKPSVEGSSPSAPANMHADIAQQVEHFLGKEEVTGSSPVISSKTEYKNKKYSILGYWVFLNHKVNFMKQSILEQSPEILRKFLGYLQTIRGKSPKTVEEYFTDLRTFFRYIKMKNKLVPEDLPFEKIPIDDVDINFIKEISLTEVFEYMCYLSEVRKNREAARSRKACSLRMFFKYLTNKTGELEANPIKELETPKKGKRLPKFLTLEQSKKLLDTVIANGGRNLERDYCIITLFLNCGIRLSELTGINMDDIREDGSLKILGKGDKERTVYLNDACKSAIENYRKVRPVDGVKDKKALFISRNNNRISAKTVQLLVGKYLELAGFKGMGYSVHKLRHTAATLMYQYGNVDIRILKDVLGHVNLGTTEIYTHISNNQVKNAIQNNPLSGEHAN